MRLDPLPDQSAVLAAVQWHPLARISVLVGMHGWRAGDTVVWTGQGHWDNPSLAGLGGPAAVARLVDALADQLCGTLVASLPRGTLPLLHRWGVAPFSEWELLATTTAPVGIAGQARWLTPAEDVEVARLLASANPDSSAQPGSDRVRRWAGIRDVSGALVCVGADTSRAVGLGHLSGIATAPAARGRGHAEALTAFLTSSLLAEGCDTVCLGMYADNDVARRLYRRLGFTEIARSSGARLLSQ